MMALHARPPGVSIAMETHLRFIIAKADRQKPRVGFRHPLVAASAVDLVRSAAAFAASDWVA